MKRIISGLAYSFPDTLPLAKMTGRWSASRVTAHLSICAAHFPTPSASNDIASYFVGASPVFNFHHRIRSGGGLSWRSDALAVRLLSRLILDERGGDPGGAAAEHHMQRAICDLLGALMASNDLLSHSSHREKTFARITDIVKHHFTDPEIGPREIADETGISLRYLQKFFTARGTTCGRFIQSLRLEHAARLVRLRNLTRSGQRLTDIAHLSGFQEYSYFARLFRHHFGYSPSTEADLDQNIDDLIM